MRNEPVRLVSVACIDPAALQAFAHQNALRLERYFPGTLRAGDSFEDAQTYHFACTAFERDRQAFVFAIAAPENSEIAGLVFLNGIYADACVGEAAGVLGAKWEGRGLMQQAMQLMFIRARDDLGLCRIRFLIGDSNERSRALANALGFRREIRKGRLFRRGTKWEEWQEYYCLSLE